MPPKKFNPEKLMKQKPVALGNIVGLKMNAIKEVESDIKRMKEENIKIQQQIDKYEAESIEVIKEYREQIDAKTTTMNELKNKAQKLREETKAKIQELYKENEKAKQNVSKENDNILEQIAETEKKMQVILEFEQNKQKILDRIQSYDDQIEQSKKTTADEIEKDKQDNIEAEARVRQENEIKLENEKNKFYALQISTADQAVLLHIQRRNNLDSDLRSLEEMRQKYLGKIDDVEKKNAKLRETIEQLHRDQLIEESADQSKQIAALQKEIAASRAQLKEMTAKTKQEHEQQDNQRKAEAEDMDLQLRQQQDLLDHKLQQIASLRELTLTVLSYRSQLEAEFITVLGEVIYEVAQRENPGVQLMQTRATRKLMMTNSGNTSAASMRRKETGGKEISISHTLAQFTMEDRMTVLTRFMERVQNSVEGKFDSTSRSGFSDARSTGSTQ